ncbi:hypothetical protein BJY52DRAFT_1223880 [Lactarius psammicola]|nr:hypothetical protein BJY52DRAFT_1223880 [Lactarius psammicola]
MARSMKGERSEVEEWRKKLYERKDIGVNRWPPPRGKPTVSIKQKEGKGHGDPADSRGSARAINPKRLEKGETGVEDALAERFGVLAVIRRRMPTPGVNLGPQRRAQTKEVSQPPVIYCQPRATNQTICALTPSPQRQPSPAKKGSQSDNNFDSDEEG